MGTRSSKEEVKTHHFFFGQVGTRNEFNKELIVVYQKMVREDDYDEWERRHGEAVRMTKQSLLVAENFDKERIKKYFACCQCPADFQMSIVYERFDFLYKTELGKRETEKNFYKQEELFLILYDWLTAAKEFQVRGIKLGDVRPSQMVITSSSKRIKLINTASFPWEMCAIDKILDKYDNNTKFYLSPEEIEYVKTPARNNKLPNSKTEAFSIGVSILEAALLENSEDLYANSPRVIDLQQLSRRIERLGKKYPLLKHYVSLLLKLAPEQRYSSGQLWSVLKVYSVQITDTRAFTRKEADQTKSLQDFRKNGNRG